MTDAVGITRSLDGGRRRAGEAPAAQPALVLALECARPQALSARYGLAGITTVGLGRGQARRATRTRAAAGGELQLQVPDGWMSSRHARIDQSFGRWVLQDTSSKNGTLVNGTPVARAVLADGDLIELGRTLFRFRDGLTLPPKAPADLDLEHTRSPISGLDTLLPAYARDLEALADVAASTIAVLIEGESGTGKEVLARAIHALSARPGQLVAVNCGAIAPNLVESELFGHQKGAFSGAIDSRPGLVRSADRGTLFLDEIGDLPPSSQAALLRVLQEREVMPVGATRALPVDLRVVAATHRDLDALIAADRFRHDLCARLVGFRIRPPALRERLDDLGILCGVLLQRVGGGAGIEPDAARQLFRYHWPLNIRELEQALATAVVLAKGGPIALEHLPVKVRELASAAPGPEAGPRKASLSAADDELRAHLLMLMREHSGNVSAIARTMGKDRKQIQRWLRRFGIDAVNYR